MNIIFVRHGESEYNASRAREDDITDTPLTKRGREQARALGNSLKKYNISEIYTSGLQRAKLTGEVVSKIIKVPIKENLSELNEYHAEHLRSILRARLSKEHSSKIRKLRKFLRKISEEKNEDKTILIVAHGFTNRIIMALLLGLPINKKLFRFTQENTCVNILRWNSLYKNWGVKVFNDYHHLPINLRHKDFR